MRRLRLQMMAGGQLPLLLNLYPNAAAAYSLRKLRTAYTGSAIRVRRSSDNAEQDIGFDLNNNLDTTALTTFCGAGNGFVTTWYDQSGVGSNMTQATAANQPQIVSSGSLITSNGLVAVQFDGSNDLMTTSVSNFTTYTNLSLFSVFTPTSASAPNTTSFILFGFAQGGGSTSDKGFSYGPSTVALPGETLTFYFSNNVINFGRLGSSIYSHSVNEQMLHSIFLLSSGTTLYKNTGLINLNLPNMMSISTDTSPNNANAVNNNVYIGSTNGIVITPQMRVQEMIFYGSNQTANRLNIDNNIKTYYNIP